MPPRRPDPVHAIYQRWARKTWRGRVIRCNRTRRSLGPVLFETLSAARGAVVELNRIAREHTAVPCPRGPHWHVQPSAKETPVAKPVPTSDAVDLSWFVGKDGDAVRAAARARLGAAAAPPVSEVADCTDLNCDACRKAARAAVG